MQASKQTNTATNMLTEDTNRDAHLEPYAKQAPVRSSEQDSSVSFVLNPSVKSADDTRSSISSDKSDSKHPRSAMRRMSSISKLPQSPRRVRFDFMGEEVLPTSSPQHTAFIAARISSPEPADHETSFTSNLATDPGEDEEEASPRKVSSSDALRALSRAPLDEDGTVWTVVNSDSEDSATDEVEFMQSDRPEKTGISPDISTTPTSPGFEVRTNTLRTQIDSKTTISSTMAQSLNKPEDDSTDDEDLLSMAKRKAQPSSSCASANSEGKVDLSTAGGENTETSNSERAHLARDETIPCEHSASYQEEEDMFYFEDDGLELTSRTPKDKPKYQEEEESEEEQSDHEIDTEASSPANLYATSLPIEIPRPNRAADGESAEDSMSASLRFHSGTVGSYKGRPLMMTVLRNPEVLDEIRSSVPIEPIVGSVHDGSPADDFNVSFLQGLDERLSTARSFKERLMIEDMMEAAKERLGKSGLQQV